MAASWTPLQISPPTSPSPEPPPFFFRNPSLQLTPTQLDITNLALRQLSPDYEYLDPATAHRSFAFGGKYRLVDNLKNKANDVIIYAKNPDGKEFAIQVARNSEMNAALKEKAAHLQKANAIAPESTVPFIEMHTASIGQENFCTDPCCEPRTMLVTGYRGITVDDQYINPPHRPMYFNPDLSLEEFINISRQFVKYYASLVTAGYVHRGITPLNVLTNPNHKISFIVSHAWQPMHAQAESWDRTPIFYRSPCVLLGASYAHTQTLFGMGCTLYEILRGLPLFYDCDTKAPTAEERMIQHLHVVFSLIPPSQAFLDALPSDWQKLVQPIIDKLTPKLIEEKERILKTLTNFEVNDHAGRPRVDIGNLYPDIFIDHFIDFVKTCVNYNEFTPPETLLAHPFMHLLDLPF